MSAPTPTVRSLSFSYRKLGAVLLAVGLLSGFFGYALASILIIPQNTASVDHGGWIPAAAMNVARSFSAFATLHNGSLLVAGGFSPGGVGSPFLSSVELYNPNSNKWTLTTPMHAGRAGAMAVTLDNGEVLVTGGLGNLTSCELYDPVSNTWTMTGNMTQGRFDHQIVLLNDGRVLVVGGGGFGLPENNVTETYNPSTGTWKTDAAQPLSRTDMIAVKLPSGTVLVAGGHTSQVSTLLSAIYDPVADTWTETGPLITPHGDAGGVLLNNKAVLIVGGYTAYNDADATIQYLYTSEIFNITSNSWKMAGDMNYPRGEIGLNIVRLSNGQVLVPGGNYQPEKGQSTSEVYNPTKGTWSMAGTMSVPHGEGAMSTLLTTGKALAFGGLLPHTCNYCGSGVTGQDLATTAADLYTPTNSTTSSQSSGTGPLITMPNGVGGNQSLNFLPANITVVIGVNNTVTWVNSDTALHTVTSQTVPAGAGSFNSGNMNAGAKFTHTFTVPGTYTYTCIFHTWMNGTVIVEA
ncbi:cupredoxin domain-containing protein [Candidatus Bathyarchaeota archaeon]|nr:cupredoxin domain-containing protein [Candidatus Bathyarchaeota archaeon]